MKTLAQKNIDRPLDQWDPTIRGFFAIATHHVFRDGSTIILWPDGHRKIRESHKPAQPTGGWYRTTATGTLKALPKPWYDG